ncbi:MAG: VPLPA-CTERM sorting domain-containing protein [Gammaproteobacteria bacterium]
MDLLLDRTGVGGDIPGLFAGEVLVTYDPARLSLDAFTISASADLVSTSSSANTFTVSFENAVDTVSDPVINIGTFDFTPGLTTGVANIDIKDAQYPLTSFANQLVGGGAGIIPFNPDPIGTSVTVSNIPLPGALWLMLSGLGVLGLVRRRA